MRKVIRICAEHEIFVLVEFHQDALSELFCGEGIPIWAATNKELFGVHASGFLRLTKPKPKLEHHT